MHQRTIPLVVWKNLRVQKMLINQEQDWWSYWDVSVEEPIVEKSGLMVVGMDLCKVNFES